MMVRGKSEIWDHFEIDGKKAKCKFCHQESFKNPSRMPVHLIKCNECPEDIKYRLCDKISKSCLNMVKKFPPMSPIIAARGGLPLPPQKRSSGSNSSNYVVSVPDGSGYEHIADIEIVNEDDLETNDIYMNDKKVKYVNVANIHADSWNDSKTDDSRMLYSEEKIVDEYSMFGDCVAHKLRSITNTQARSIAQYYINTILFRAEMTNFAGDVTIPSPDEFPLFDKILRDRDILS